MFAQLNTHLAPCVIDDRVRARRNHSQRSLVEASLLVVGDRRDPRDSGRR
jgi:hypothetical protein